MFQSDTETGCHEWSVDIDDGVFGDGWRRFVRENGVQEFEIILFKHQGSMVFEFLVFDQSTCERQYPNIFEEMYVEELSTESDTIFTHKMVYMKWLFKGLKNRKKRKRNDYASDQDQENFQVKKETGFTKKKATTLTPNNHPYFISNLKPCSFKMSVLHLPIHFTTPNCFKVGELILIDNQGRSWPVYLNKIDKNRFYIGCGFKAFRVANSLKEGDAFKFELVEKEKNKPPVVNFLCPFRFEEDDRRYIMGKLKSKLHQLYLPQDFVRLNGLLNKKKVILKNTEDERLWWVDLKKYKNMTCYIMGQGWKDFRVANGLKEGDCFKLSVVDGDNPIVSFYLQKKSLKNR
ncbi:unnamed protein product [Lactuca virosa]|uniref:TF-B3 domain-containing protein n=1 Tax=Lactuca virosa TaxID=75947 RepID=A0AAU9NX58_9ASTR|nr:unnamed protein product [Lactuca virosa]